MKILMIGGRLSYIQIASQPTSRPCEGFAIFSITILPCTTGHIPFKKKTTTNEQWKSRVDLLLFSFFKILSLFFSYISYRSMWVWSRVSWGIFFVRWEEVGLITIVAIDTISQKYLSRDFMFGNGFQRKRVSTQVTGEIIHALVKR